MTLNFADCVALFRKGEINKLSLTPEGSRFLKLRSIARTELMEEFSKIYKIVLPVKKREYFPAIFESRISEDNIISFIKMKYIEDRRVRKAEEDDLVSELYKVESFGWAGSNAGGLERSIVDNYVKKIRNYDGLKSSIRGELIKNVDTYVTSSWYNHWTSIIIEDLINDHERVLPAIGRIPKIDFFVDNYPYDLKVTFLPEEYISDYRKLNKLGVEKTILKKVCKELNLPVIDSDKKDLSVSVLWNQLADNPSELAEGVISKQLKIRNDCLTEAMNDPKNLATWLYENQGERRFDSSNRMFIILCDSSNFFESWKLKRAKPLIDKQFKSYLSDNREIGFELDFNWENQKYSVIADVIFIIK